MSAVCTQTTHMDVSGLRVPSPVKPGQPGQCEQPYVHSPIAAHEPPPVRNMSMSTASTSGSVELPQPRPHEPDSSQSAGTFMSGQARHRSSVLSQSAEAHVFCFPFSSWCMLMLCAKLSSCDQVQHIPCYHTYISACLCSKMRHMFCIMLRPEGGPVGGWVYCLLPELARMLRVFSVTIQTVSFAPPEGFMDVDTSAPKERKGSTAESIISAVASSALQEVATNLANVKSAIRSGAADRNQVIDMLTNLLRETLQVSHDLLCNSLQAPCHLSRDVFCVPGSSCMDVWMLLSSDLAQLQRQLRDWLLCSGDNCC